MRFTSHLLFAAVAGSLLFCHHGLAHASLIYPANVRPLDSVIQYDARKGNIDVVYPRGSNSGYALIQLTSKSSLFLTTGKPLPPIFEPSPFTVFRNDKIAYLTVGDQPLLQSFTLESILPPFLAGDVVASDLTFVYSCPADACAPMAGLTVVPEPTSYPSPFPIFLFLVVARHRPWL